jgi:hypothetical protein
LEFKLQLASAVAPPDKLKLELQRTGHASAKLKEPVTADRVNAKAQRRQGAKGLAAFALRLCAFAVLSHNIVVSCEDFYRGCTASHFRSAGWQPAVSPTASRRNVKTSNALRIANPRYSRLPVCATLVAASPRCAFALRFFSAGRWGLNGRPHFFISGEFVASKFSDAELMQ